MNNKEIEELKQSHTRLLEGCKQSLQWIAKVAADADHAPDLKCRAIRYYNNVQLAINRAVIGGEKDENN